MTINPSYVTIGSSAGFSGTGTCVNGNSTLTVAAATFGLLIAGETIAGTLAANFPANTTVLEQLTGPPGGAGTYEMSAEATATEATATAFNTGAQTISVDVSQGLGSAVAVEVTLSAALTLANPMPPGFPIEPSQTGAAVSTFYAPGSVIPSGTTLSVFRAVATALINAGAATLG